MKAYTDLEQSKMLVEILPLESADMHYERAYFEGKQSDWFIALGRPIKSEDVIPCWSLAALLSVLPPIEGFRPIIDLDINLIRYEGNYRDKLCFYGNNLIDVCYEMIIKLHKLKKL